MILDVNFTFLDLDKFLPSGQCPHLRFVHWLFSVQPTKWLTSAFEVVVPLSSQLPAFVLILQFQLWRSVKFWPNFCLFSFCTWEVAAMAVVARFWSNFLSSCGQSAKVAIVSFASNWKTTNKQKEMKEQQEPAKSVSLVKIWGRTQGELCSV